MPQQAMNPIPEGLHSLTAQLWFNGDCRDAVEFYEKALGALVIGNVEFTPESKVMHAMLLFCVRVLLAVVDQTPFTGSRPSQNV